ncbi:hypothetical protein IIE26_27110 (plasmid) [Cytobacillus oceanisediminis]|nr:hypothetical protein [Cytobacillus oceanisediminis]QOK30040.1 hypothetical protein IIE26_27110 [Cytobacillus oceanisediminis]
MTSWKYAGYAGGEDEGRFKVQSTCSITSLQLVNVEKQKLVLVEVL